MKVLELFCGTKSISKVFKDRGHEVFTVEVVPEELCEEIVKVCEIKGVSSESEGDHVFMLR